MLRLLVERWLIFAGVIGLMAALNEGASEWINHKLALITARVAAGILALGGFEGRADGTLIHSSMCNFEIIGECTGYYPAAILLAAIVAYPCSWKTRLLGIAFGVPAILLINQVRVVSLCWIYDAHRAIFEIAHVLVWQSLILFFTVLIWIIWAVLFVRDDEARTR